MNQFSNTLAVHFNIYLLWFNMNIFLQQTFSFFYISDARLPFTSQESSLLEVVFCVHYLSLLKLLGLEESDIYRGSIFKLIVMTELQ
jgi:hypothetical protein